MQKIITINEKFNTMKSFFRQKLSLRSEADANQKMIKFVSKNLNFSSLRLYFSKKFSKHEARYYQGFGKIQTNSAGNKSIFRWKK
jgi:hypothetical protein